MIRLVCLDIDGTLVGASGEPHRRVWSAVERARQSGIHIALCSGRPGFGVTRDLAVRIAPQGIHCFQNGASIVDFNSGRSLSTALAADVVALLIARARSRRGLLELYTDDAYVAEEDAERLRRHAGLLGVPFAPRSFDALDGPIVRAQWLVPHAEAPAVLAEPHAGLEVSPSLAPSMPDTTFVSLTRKGVNKGSAVDAIAAALSLQLEDVMYVGDGFNDAPAMRVVGWPMAVHNAEPIARELARGFVPGPESGGVAEALETALRLNSSAGGLERGGR